MSKKVGKFDIIGFIARGGFSDVYLAKEPSLDVQVAIKVFAAEQTTADSDSAWRQRFLQESQILHSLSSAPNIVNFMEFGFTEANKPYIVMPYYKRTLADLLDEDNRLSQTRCIQIAKQVLTALQAIHRAGILHLDIKPSNLLIDDNEQIQLADFGISELLHQIGCQQTNDTNGQMSERTEKLGSRYFASPEQLEGTNTLTIASDMYSLAAVLFRCYMGKHVHTFNINSREETQDSFLSFLSKILQKEASKRPQSAADFLSLVNAFEHKHKHEFNQSLNSTSEPVNNERELDDNATQILSASHQGATGENNKFVQIKDDIVDVLRKHGRVDGFDFERLSLLAKSTLHDDFDSFNLQEYIKVLKQQLIRNEPAFARFVLWLDQVDEQIKQGMKEQKPGLSKNARENLVQLGIAVLPSKSDAMTDNVDSLPLRFDRNALDSLIEARLNDFVAKEDNNKQRQESSALTKQKKSAPSYLPKSMLTRIGLTLFLIFVAALIPNINEFGDQTLPSPQDEEAYTAPKNAMPVPKVDSNEATLASPAKVDSERVFSIRFDIQPTDAEVSFQNENGEMVSSERLTVGTYTVRISKTGYSTEKQNLQLDASAAKDKIVTIKANLAISNSRYFIGETDRSVADGSPLEFILLPKIDASSERIRMMSFEVTNELYQHCIDDGECIASTLLSQDPREVIFEQADHPVVNVSWHDIHDNFIPWLSKKIDRTLRLPTEQEWMFAASAGKTGEKYSWGEQFRFDQAHCRDCYSVEWRADDYRFSTRPVMSFSANQWQLFDLHGNVQEWTKDCVAAASTSLQQRCDQAIVKGGSWFTNHIGLTIQANQALQKNARSHTTGFRLVEIIEPTMQTGSKDEE